MLIAAVFLVGTYAVATLDDLIRMKASRSFLYIWAAIAVAALYFQDYYGDDMLMVRIAICAFVILAMRTGIVGIKTAWGDIVAVLPGVALLPIVHVGVFLVLVWVVDKIVLRIIYAKLLRRSAYPFMPAILGAMVLTLIIFYSADLQPIIKLFSGTKGNETAVNATGGAA